MAERITENIVRDQLREFGYYNPDNGISIEEQKSEIARIKALLSKASKNSKGNKGYPEFIRSNSRPPNAGKGCAARRATQRACAAHGFRRYANRV